MRGNLQAANVRVLAALPGARWPIWLEQTKQRRQRDRLERLEVIDRLQAEERRARRAGAYAPGIRRW